MELDKFRNVDLVIDHVNKNFFSRQFVSQNDNNGRTLTVQVTDNGAAGEVTGLSLNLRWSNQSTGLTDLSAFTLIDKKNSVFQIKYPKNMLNPGTVIAAIQIIQNGQVSHTKQFEIIVQNLAGEAKGIIQKAEYSALIEVLADSNKFRTDIDTLENEKAEKTALATTNSNISAIENNKVDKGGVSQVGWGMLDQEAKENIAGNKTAVVGPNGVSTENIVDKAVTLEKLSNDHSMIKYPFSSNSRFDKPSNKNIFKDIKIYHADVTKKYCIAGLFRNNNNVWRIFVSILNSNGTIGDSVATWQKTGYEEPITQEWITLTPANSADGKVVDVLIDWSLLIDGNSFGTGSRDALIQVNDVCYRNEKFPVSYPFSKAHSKIFDDRLTKAFLNINVIGGNIDEDYCIASMQKNNEGTYRFIISKFENGQVSTEVASWNRRNYVPEKEIETIKVEKSANGLDVEIQIDWRVLNDGVYGTNYLGNVLVFDKKTYSPLQLPINKNYYLYPVNPQYSFPDYAFFSGNWQKRNLDGKEVMTSCIPTSGMFLGFKGTKLEGKFIRDRAGLELVVQIDEGEPFKKWIDDINQVTLIADGLDDCEHVVKIFADPYFGTSDSDKHSFYTYKGSLNVVGFEQETYPVFTEEKILMAYGDSFTAGGGGTLANSYASYCAELLGMGCHRVAQGGAALVERSDRLFIPNLQQISFQASDAVDCKAQKANLVTINIGTNDTKSVVTDEIYENNMRAYISRLKRRHFGAPIILMGDWVNKYTQICKKIGEDTENVFFVDVSSWTYPRQDDLHPTDEGHKIIGEYLANAIRELSLAV